MPQSLPISQLTLMNIPSSKKSKVTVFCEVNCVLNRYVVEFDEASSIGSIIAQTVKLVKLRHPEQGFKDRHHECNLYASKKNGNRVSDLPSFEHRQKIIQTGVKYFHLTDLLQETGRKSNDYSTSINSVESEMQVTRPKGKEIIPQKMFGCFCFA